MNKTILFVFLAILFTFPTHAFAHMENGMMDSIESDINETHLEDEDHLTIDQVIPNLLNKYKVNTIKELNCSDITEEEFEKIGDAWMEVMHPGATHTEMDQMMGGEGSESLKLMHINMGERYLGCSSNNQGFGMMGSGMMGSGMMRGGALNNWNNHGEGFFPMMGGISSIPMGLFSFGMGWFSIFLFWVVIIGGIIMFVIWLRNLNKSNKMSDPSAIDILKIRYAKGKVTKKEYESMKKDLL